MDVLDEEMKLLQGDVQVCCHALIGLQMYSRIPWSRLRLFPGHFLIQSSRHLKRSSDVLPFGSRQLGYEARICDRAFLMLTFA